MEAVDAPLNERTLARALLWSALAAGAVLRVHLALTDDGLYWPDEIYQGLEPAHRLVFGYGLRAWEFIDGARTFAVPGVAALVMKISSLLGLPEPRGYLVACKLAFGAISLATAWASALLARRLSARPLAAAFAGAFCALAAPSIYFSNRALSEPSSALPLALGLAFALPRSASTRDRVIGALLLSVSVYFRLLCAIFCAGLLVVLAARRDFRALRTVALSLLCGAAAFTLVDHLAWGGLLHSPLVFLRFSLLEGRATLWGSADAAYYARALFRAMPAVVLLLAPLALCAAPRAGGLLFLTALFFALHMATPHKELRFILPTFPLLGALAALGLEQLWSAAQKPLRLTGAGLAAALGILLVASAARVSQLRFFDLGQYEGSRDRLSAWDDFGDYDRLLERAGKLADLCGLKIEGTHIAWTGGYGYLHKRVPLYHFRAGDRANGHYNYAIGWKNKTKGKLVAADRSAVLVKVSDSCTPDPGWSDKLP